MLIGIDGNEANVAKRVGVGEYGFELLRQFSGYKGKGLGFRIYLKDKPRNGMPKTTDDWGYRVIQPRPFWTQIALPLDLYFNQPRPDVFFTPTHYAPRFSPIPTVISIMDVSYIHFPEMFRRQDLYKLQHWTKRSARCASAIFTISKASRDDIIKTYGLPGERVVVTYPGVKHKTQNAMENAELIKEKFQIKGDFILFVGTLQPRKNIARLIEAFSKINPSTRATPHAISLVIVGKKGWQYEEILAAPKKYGVEEKVRFLDFVSDEELAMLYQHAICFVLPSLYEGFGLPVLEAMQYDCPVITSNVSSLPEAGGDAAVYVNPYDVDDIAGKISQVLDDKKLRMSMVEKGRKQVAKFDWEKTAKETLVLLEQVAQS